VPQKPSRPTASAKNETGEFERFTRFVRGIVNVPGSEVKQQIENEKKARANKRAKSFSSSRASRAKD
jgi:hypothetical protein